MSHSFSEENFEKLNEFIYRKSAIYLEKKHYNKLAVFIDKYLLDNSIESFTSYFFKLRFDDKDGSLFQKLVNAITINDTYFYRENEHFELLRDAIIPELHKNTPANRPLRILSAPCSSGEEAYSIVLHLLEEAEILKKRTIEIVGIDINSQMIEKAKKAEYTKRSVHVMPEDMLHRWFEKKESNYVLSSRLYTSVDFQVANVYDKNQMRQLGKFDVIFSRNMLIYFNEASRKEVAMTFYDMLHDNGYIFLGHAEHMKRIVSVFKTKKIDQVLVYQK